MSKYFISISKTAQKQLDKLPNPMAERLITAIRQLADNPRPPGYKKLKGRDGYRIRRGSYRIVYDIFDNVMLVHIIAIGHRKDIYN